MCTRIRSLESITWLCWRVGGFKVGLNVWIGQPTREKNSLWINYIRCVGNTIWVIDYLSLLELIRYVGKAIDVKTLFLLASYHPSDYFMFGTSNGGAGFCLSRLLKVADFSYNFLVGKVPPCLSYLPRCEWVGTNALLIIFPFHAMSITFGMLLSYSFVLNIEQASKPTACKRNPSHSVQFGNVVRLIGHCHFFFICQE